MPTSLVRTVALAAAAAVVLASCGGGDDATTDAGSTTTDAGITIATVDTVEPMATDVSTADRTVTTAAAAPATAASEPDGGECLVGAWAVTEEQMNSFYAGVMETFDAPMTITTSGVANLTFAADGTYAWAPLFTLTIELAGQRGTGETTGTVTGDWTAVDGSVTTASDVNALVTSVTVNGTTFAGDDLANGFLNGSPVNGVTYSCDGSSPVLDFKTADPAVTVPVTLTPA